MKFNYLTSKDKRNLIKNLFVIKFSKDDLNFETVITPLGLPSIAYIANEKQKTLIKGTEKSVKGLTIFGQFDSAYKFYINKETTNIGINLTPTALYRILNKDIYQYTNNHISLEEVNKILAEKLEPVFVNNIEDLFKFEKEIINLIDSLPLTEDKDVIFIEKAIDYINKKEGIVKVKELLTVVPYSQKSLQTKFKKIVGLTPVKFIKITRFNSLLIKYHIKKTNINELLYTYNYYDISHFNRDFKSMMNQEPKLFFEQKNHPFLDQYLTD